MSADEQSVCGIHRDTGPVCERCRLHREWLVVELANTTPYYEIVRERERMEAMYPNRSEVA